MTTQAERLGTTHREPRGSTSSSSSARPRTTTTRCPSWSPRPRACWVTDVEGKRYLDMLAAYSALNFGHRHPALIAAAKEQLDRVTLTSRAFHNDQMGPFLRDLAELCGMDMALPMNTGAEAVETAIKTARKWGYEVKGVAPDRAKMIVCERQLPRPHDHDRQLLDRRGARRRTSGRSPRGSRSSRTATPPRSRPRSTTTPSPSSSSRSRARPASSSRPRATCARARELCTERGVLLVADEIQIRPRPHGDDVRVRARGRPPGRVHPRQGARRRDRAAVRGRGRRGRPRRLQARGARQHVRRQPARVRDRAPGRRDAADRRVPGGARRELGAYLHPALRGAEPRHRRGGPRPRPVGRDRARRGRRPARRSAERLLEEGVLAKDTHDEHPPARAAARDRARTSSTGASSGSSRCSSARPRTSGPPSARRSCRGSRTRPSPASDPPTRTTSRAHRRCSAGRSGRSGCRTEAG